MTQTLAKLPRHDRPRGVGGRCVSSSMRPELGERKGRPAPGVRGGPAFSKSWALLT